MTSISTERITGPTPKDPTMGYTWNGLPDELRASIEGQTGTVTCAVPPTAGTVSDFAATLETTGGQVFCKAVRDDNPLAWMHRRESVVNTALPPGIAPRMLWKVEAGGWLALGFECVPGRHADLSPGSADLPMVARTLETLAETLTPAPPLRTFSLAKRWSDQDFWHKLGGRHRDRLDPWTMERLERLILAEREAPGLVDGRTLVHTDLTGPNLLVDGDSVHVVDWAFPAPGAAWVDTAYMVIRLIEAGHTPEEAEQWADGVPMWHEASPWAVTAFGTILTGMRTLRAVEAPGRQWDALSGHGLAWLRHRLR
ncbi:phosphotransferase family protein [Kitasatospora sp. NPDC092286]|uniref:phosphotransferase family protein n=1 Tax=Kitasatospora sp. NPDC092286 TaxID=3364087 RepID=UPI003810ECA8